MQIFDMSKVRSGLSSSFEYAVISLNINALVNFISIVWPKCLALFGWVDGFHTDGKNVMLERTGRFYLLTFRLCA